MHKENTVRQKNLTKKDLAKTKITALIPNYIVSGIQKHTGAKNTTESLILALDDWLRKEDLKKLFNKIRKNPLEFQYSAKELRTLNRKIT